MFNDHYHTLKELKLRSEGLIMPSEKLVQGVDYFAIIDPYFSTDSSSPLLAVAITIDGETLKATDKKYLKYPRNDAESTNNCDARILNHYIYSDRTIVHFRLICPDSGYNFFLTDDNLDFAREKGYTDLSPQLKSDDNIIHLMFPSYLLWFTYDQNIKDTKLDLNAKVPFNVITRDEAVLLKPFDEIIRLMHTKTIWI